MGRVMVVAVGVLALGALAGCESKYDCAESCSLMRDCGLLVGTSRETCEVRCVRHEDDQESGIDACGDCVDGSGCSRDCVADCVCALSLDLAEYPGVVCGI